MKDILFKITNFLATIAKIYELFIKIANDFRTTIVASHANDCHVFVQFRAALDVR